MIKFFPLFFLFLSCGSSSSNEFSDDSYTIIYKSEMGGIDMPRHLLIRNNESYIQFIESLKVDESIYSNFLKIDFNKNDILILFQGQQNTGGYEINIESLKNENNTIFIKKKVITPKRGEMTTSVITSPLCIAIIPKAKNLIIQ